MRIRIFDREERPITLVDLRCALTFRQGAAASFWLGEGDGPLLAVMVNGEDSCVHYFPSPGHPGFYAAGPTLDWENHVAFVADNRDATAVPVAMVVPWRAAAGAAEEFFQSKSRPASLNWEEL